MLNRNRKLVDQWDHTNVMGLGFALMIALFCAMCLQPLLWQFVGAWALLCFPVAIVYVIVAGYFAATTKEGADARPVHGATETAELEYLREECGYDDMSPELQARCVKWHEESNSAYFDEYGDWDEDSEERDRNYWEGQEWRDEV